MKEFVFRLARGRALLLTGDSLPAERARFRIEDEKSGTLVLADQQYPFSADGIILSAAELHNGLYTPAIFADGKRFEASPISIGAGYFFFLPPTHAQLCRLEEEIHALTASSAELSRRLCKIEARIQDTTIF